MGEPARLAVGANQAARIPTDPMLFRLSDDPGETRNVIDANEPLAREIHQRYARWLKEVGTPAEHSKGRRSLR